MSQRCQYATSTAWGLTLREQISTGRFETHISAALMHRQPAALDGERHARAVFGRAALVLEQKRTVDQLDVEVHPSNTGSTVLAISTMRRAALLGSA